MDLRKIIITIGLLLVSTATYADPITAFFVAAGNAIASITIGQVIFTAGSLLFGSAQQRKLKKKILAEQRRQKDEYNAGLSDRTVNGIGSEFPSRHVFGKARIGGNIVDIITSGERDEYQHLIVLATQHQVEDFEEVYINGKAVGALDGSGFATVAPFGKIVTSTESSTVPPGSDSSILAFTPDANSVTVTWSNGEVSVPVSFELSGTLLTTDSAYNSQIKYVEYTRQKTESTIRITKHLGVPGGSYDVNTNVETAGKLKTTSVFNGHSYLAIRLDLNEPEFQSLPSIEMLVKRESMFDVRTGTVTSAAGTNPALVAHEYLKGPLCDIESITLPTAQYITAANDCDVLVDNGDGNRKRYTFNGMISSDQSREEVLQRIADSMAGGIVATTWDIYAGVYRAPVMTLNETDIVGSLAVTPGASELEIFNTVYGRFATADNAWLEKDYKRYVQSTYVTADGGELEVGITYPYTITQTAVDQLNRIAMEQARNDFTISATFSLKAWKLKVGDRVFWTSPFMGQTNATYRVVDRSSGNSPGVSLVLKQDTEEMYDLFDAVTPPYVPPTTIPNPWFIQAPTSVAVDSGTDALTPQGDGTLIAGMLVSWVNGASTTVSRGNFIEVEAERLTGASLPDVLRAQAPGNATSLLLNPAQEGETYRVRVRAINAYTGAASVWVYLTPHVVVGKTEAPPAFDLCTVLAQPDGTRQMNFAYTTTTKPPDWKGCDIRYTTNLSETDISLMTRLQDDKTFYTNSPVETNSPIEGNYRFAFISLDRSDILSAPVFVNINLPKRRTGNVFDEFFEHVDSWTGTLSGFVELPTDDVSGTFLEATDAETWDSLTTWDAWSRWNRTPSSPCVYTSPARDLGTVLAGQVDAKTVAEGTVLVELRTSVDGTTWSSWGSISAAFTNRWIQTRCTVTATGGSPVPTLYEFSYQVSVDLKKEYINDIDIAVAHPNIHTRFGAGDIRLQLGNVYTVLKLVDPIVQDSSAGTWSWQIVDKTANPGPRIQFKKNGTLTDPVLADFYIEGI